MRKNNPRYKAYIRKRNIDKFKKKIYRDRFLSGYFKKDRNADGKRIKTFLMPENFSLINNFEEVINTFVIIKNFIKLKNFHYDVIDLNFSSVSKITVDALMYLLVFIKNTRNPHKNELYIKGNLPKDKDCALKMKNTGFLKYLSSSIKQENSNENVNINVGDDVDVEKFKVICDFVQEKLMISRLDTMDLYNSLGEIIGNSNEHAYLEKVAWHKWLSFAKYENDIIKIVLLDSGSGIITTMKKRIAEGIFKDNTHLLESALNGENRSETKLFYRGRGLPRIRESAVSGNLKRFSLITNNVLYTCYNKKEEYKLLNGFLDGTLYYFELESKKEII